MHATRFQRLSLSVALLMVGCGRRNYDTSTDAGLDAVLEGADSGSGDAAREPDAHDAPLDVDTTSEADAPRPFDASTELDASLPDAPTPPPLDVRPEPLRAADWTLRPYVSVGASGCLLLVDYPPDGGSPGDRIRVRLTGCPTTGGDFVQYLEYLPFHFEDLADGRTFCSIAVTLDTRLDSVADPTGMLELYIGVTGTDVAGAPGVTGSWFTAVSSTSAGSFTRNVGDVNLNGAVAAGMSRTDPVYLTLAVRRRDWTTSADFEASFDNPTFRIDFARDGRPECDGTP